MSANFRLLSNDGIEWLPMKLIFSFNFPILRMGQLEEYKRESLLSTQLYYTTHKKRKNSAKILNSV